MFVNSLALRNFPKPGKVFRDFLADVKHRTLDAFENQDYQVELLVEQVVGKRDAVRNPLFDVMFTLQNMEGAGVEIEGLKVKPYEYENKIAKFDMQLVCYEMDEKLRFEFEYCTKRFRKESIERFVCFFKAIVSSVIADPGKKLSEIQIVSEEEVEEIQFQFIDNLENE
jgi:non-ribosomal peptide synthetase component F